MPKKNKNKPKFIDLFSGCGGFTIGFEKAGFKCVFANDIEPDFIETFKTNNPGVPTSTKDIKNVFPKEIFELSGTAKGEIDLIVGGPPCQGFSTVGKRWIDDPRNKLFKEYYRIVRELEPKMFVFENVTGLVSIGGGSVLEEIIRLFSDLGYKVQDRVLNAVEYGIPQNRERVIIVGSTIKEKKFRYPSPTHALSHNLLNGHLKPALLMRDALSDLPPIEAGEKTDRYASGPHNEYQKARRKNCKKLTHHDAPAHGRSLLRVISHVPEGGTMKDIPPKFRPKSGYPNSYARLWWDRPSTTLTRNFGTPSSARCIHPKCDRGLTSREGARLQSFNDDFIFVGSRSSRNLQIGNAVPPLLTEAIAKEVMKVLS